MKAKTKQPKLTYIYADAEEKYVKNVVLYSNAAGEVFYDEQLTQPVPGKDLQNLYLKGLVVFNTESQQYLTPTQFTVNGEEGTIDFGGNGGGSNVTPSTTRIYSLMYSTSAVVDINEDNTIGTMRVYSSSKGVPNGAGEEFMRDYYDPTVRCYVIQGGVDFSTSGRTPEMCKEDITEYWQQHLEGTSGPLYEPSEAYFYTDGNTDGYYAVCKLVTNNQFQQHLDGFTRRGTEITEPDEY